MVEMTYIYTISHPLTHEVRYIGKSNTPSKRLSTHIRECNKIKSHKNNWIKSILNSGLDPHMDILDEVPIIEWEYWEKYWISQFKQWGFRLTNHSDGGIGPIGVKRSNEFKKKIREIKMGIPLSDEHKKKISIQGIRYHQENPHYNIRGKNVRTYIDVDLLYDLYITENLSIPQISKKINISEKKILENLHLNDIKKEDGWWLNNLSEKYKKTVLQYDLNGNLLREWDGIVDINNELGYNSGNIANCCRGGIKSSNRYIWRYKDEYVKLDISNILTKSKSRTHLSIIQKTIDNKIIKRYAAIKDAVRDGFKSYNILRCCDGKSKTYKGFVWEFETNIKNSKG